MPALYFSPTIRPDVSCATAYLGDSPVATVQRRRIYSRGPMWSAYDLKGQLIGCADTAHGARTYVRRHVQLLEAEARAALHRAALTQCAHGLEAHRCALAYPDYAPAWAHNAHMNALHAMALEAAAS